jgi:hypothetical protein
MMFHVKHKAFGTASLILTVFFSFGQGRSSITDKPFEYRQPVDSSIRHSLENNNAYLQLGEKEREFFYWVNVLRKDPSNFSRNYLLPFIAQFHELYGQDSKSLEEDLNNTGPLEPAQPDLGLNRTAKAHATDLAGHHSALSHYSSRGESFAERMRMAGIEACAGENLFDGRNEPLKALLLLLIDQGVPGYGHRKNLLRSEFRKMGVAIVQRPERKDVVVLVQQFACR